MERFPGVSLGTTNYYEFNYTTIAGYTTLQSFDTTDSQLLYSATSATVIVENLSDTNITVQMTYTFDGTAPETTEEWVDIDSGNASSYETKWFFISANLTAGDYLYSSASSPLVNETVTRSYLGADRETNHVRQEFYVFDVQKQKNYTLIYDYYWDRSTGALLERNEIQESQDTIESSFNIIIKQSNTITEYSPTLILPFLAMTLLLIAIFYARQKPDKWTI